MNQHQQTDIPGYSVVDKKIGDVQAINTDVIAVSMCEANQDRPFFSDTIVPLKDAVARRAYEIYVEEGSQPGRDAENWAKAEAQLDTREKA